METDEQENTEETEEGLEEEVEEAEEEQEMEDFSKLRVVDLRERLADLDLPIDGKKAVLIERLEEHYSAGPAGADATPVEDEQEEEEVAEDAGDEAKEELPAKEEEAEQPVRAKRERKEVARLEAGPATAKWSEYAAETAETDADETEEDEDDTAEILSSLTVAVLKKRLADFGMPTDGKKAILIERLQDVLTNGVPEMDEEEENEEDEEEEEVEYLTKEAVKSWTVAELKAELGARELPTTGVKATLIKRLQKEL